MVRNASLSAAKCRLAAAQFEALIDGSNRDHPAFDVAEIS
jgi:hypothetical protein